MSNFGYGRRFENNAPRGVQRFNAGTPVHEMFRVVLTQMENRTRELDAHSGQVSREFREIERRNNANKRAIASLRKELHIIKKLVMEIASQLRPGQSRCTRCGGVHGWCSAEHCIEYGRETVTLDWADDVPMVNLARAGGGDDGSLAGEMPRVNTPEYLVRQADSL